VLMSPLNGAIYGYEQNIVEGGQGSKLLYDGYFGMMAGRGGDLAIAGQKRGVE
jgi:hypothetical protein